MMAALTALKLESHKCVVYMPSGKEISCSVTNLTSGYKLLGFICQKEGIVESQYFGFKYTHHKDGKRTWLQMKKFLGRQLHSKLYELDFHIKYWPSSPYAVKYDATRYQMLLDTRRKLLKGELSCVVPTQALLASYIIQGEIGDWSDGMILPGKFPMIDEDLKFFPAQSSDFKQQVISFHQKHSGITPATADLLYLENVRRLSLHGMEMHPVLDADNVAVIVGVNHEGLTVVLNGIILNRILWTQVTDIQMANKHLFIALKLNVQNQLQLVKLGFSSPTHLDLKRLYRSARDTWKFHQGKFSAPANTQTEVEYERVSSKIFLNNNNIDSDGNKEVTRASPNMSSHNEMNSPGNGPIENEEPNRNLENEVQSFSSSVDLLDEDDEEPIILEQSDVIAEPDQPPTQCTKEESDKQQQEEAHGEEEFEAINLTVNQENNEPTKESPVVIATETPGIVIDDSSTREDQEDSLSDDNHDGPDTAHNTELLRQGDGVLERSIIEDEEAMECIDQDTVVVETSEYTTEELDPETANVMVVTHTTYTEIETTPNMLSSTSRELLVDDQIIEQSVEITTTTIELNRSE